MDKNTFIGFYHRSEKAYCKRCDHLYEYHWNGCNPLSENNICPKCNKHDEVISESRVEIRIDFLRMMIRSENILSDDQKRNTRKDISDLNAIRRKFDQYKEKSKTEMN